MFKFMRSAVMAFALIFLVSGCTSVTPGPGEEAVLIDKPYLFGSEGVRRDETIKTGRSFEWFSTDYVLVNMTPQTADLSFNDFSSSDNILLDFSTTIQYRVTDAALMIDKFGPQWLKNNIESQYTAIVRNEVKGRTMSQMMSNVEVAQAVDDAVTEKIRALVKENGIPVEIINITLGRARPNDDVLEQMNKTAAEQQRELTMIAATRAEKEREKEQAAKAAADNAYRNALGLTPQQYLEREIAELYANACEKSSNCVVAPSGTSVIVGK